MILANPWLLLLLIPFGLLYLFWRGKKFLGYSSLYHVREPAGFKKIVTKLPKPIFFGAVFSAIIAISHPQTKYHKEETTLRGREIVLSIDTSFSMTGTAIETIKKIVGNFIKKRPNDLIKSPTIFLMVSIAVPVMQKE